MKNALNLLFKFFASFGLAIAIFVFLFLLILFGTLFQVDHGLYEAQTRYFESFYVIHAIGPISIPLPGGYLLLVLLSINLICGGIVRLRKNRYSLGILITHLGVLVMLISSGITFHFSDRGHMRLYPDQQSDVFSSFNEWTIEIGKPAAGATIHRIPEEQFTNLGPGQSRTFYADALPFDVILSGFASHSVPERAGARLLDAAGVVDGFQLRALPSEKESERNVPGLYATLTDKASGEVTEAILWGLAMEPMTVKTGGLYYTIGLARKTWKVPFTVRLDEFNRELHPGTGMAASFDSYITKIEGESEEKIRIWMNHPLRDRGYTFFQASWGPENALPGQPLFSVFEVVRNPTDQGPLVACIIISIGLLIHFLQKLARHMRTEARRRTA